VLQWRSDPNKLPVCSADMSVSSKASSPSPTSPLRDPLMTKFQSLRNRQIEIYIYIHTQRERQSMEPCIDMVVSGDLLLLVVFSWTFLANRHKVLVLKHVFFCCCPVNSHLLPLTSINIRCLDCCVSKGD
jgi:hypothetical protein